MPPVSKMANAVITTLGRLNPRGRNEERARMRSDLVTKQVEVVVLWAISSLGTSRRSCFCNRMDSRLSDQQTSKVKSSLTHVKNVLITSRPRDPPRPWAPGPIDSLASTRRTLRPERRRNPERRVPRRGFRTVGGHGPSDDFARPSPAQPGRTMAEL